jgi:hypothetical protein
VAHAGGEGRGENRRGLLEERDIYDSPFASMLGVK